MQLRLLPKIKVVNGVDQQKNSRLIILTLTPIQMACILTFIYLLVSYFVTAAISPFIKDSSSVLLVSLIICGLVLIYVTLAMSLDIQRY